MTRSANLNFFAAETDQRAVLDFVFSSTDLRVFESYSEYSSELREFHSTEELAEVFPLGTDPYGNCSAILLELWSPSVMHDLAIRRLELAPAYCDGHTFRYCIEGGGLMQLHLGGLCERTLTMSHFGHQSQARAQAWDVGDGINWKSLQTLSNRIQYHVRKRLAAGKAGSMPVLAQALELAKSGYALKIAAHSSTAFELRTESK